jgi:hypothetical protein
MMASCSESNILSYSFDLAALSSVTHPTQLIPRHPKVSSQLECCLSASKAVKIASAMSTGVTDSSHGRGLQCRRYWAVCNTRRTVNALTLLDISSVFPIRGLECCMSVPLPPLPFLYRLTVFIPDLADLSKGVDRASHHSLCRT